jgi:hypothetical protein
MHKAVGRLRRAVLPQSVKGALTVEDPAAIRLQILRYRCLLHGMLDGYMRQALSEMLAKEETKLSELNRAAERL